MGLAAEVKLVGLDFSETISTEGRVVALLAFMGELAFVYIVGEGSRSEVKRADGLG